MPVRPCWTLAVLALVVGAEARAEEPKPIEPGPWKFGATAGLNLSQSSFSSNWAGGDKGSIVWVLNANLSGERQFNRIFNLANTLQLAYGQIARQRPDPASPGELVWDVPEKTTDQIVFESTGRLTLQTLVDPYGSLRLDSQFLDQSSPVGDLRFNPIKLKEAFGVARVLEKTEEREAITRLGIGFRQTFARSFVNPPTRETASFTANDGGGEWQTTVKRPIMGKAVLYQGTLLVFQPVFYSGADALEDYDARARVADPAHDAVANFWKATDVNFKNVFSAQITKLLSVILEAQLVYDKFDAAANVDNALPLAVLKPEIDKNVRKAGQFRETLALALTYRLF